MVTIGGKGAAGRRRAEGWTVLGIVLCAMLATGGYVLVTGGVPRTPPLLDWQRSAFADLGPDDQAIYSALNTTAVDIGWLNYDSGLWPPPEELDSYLMQPFTRDAFWEEHGRVEWRLLASATVTTGGATAYYGGGGTRPGQSAYLLIFQHRHMGGTFSNQSDVWINADPAAPPPDSYLNEALIRAGWKKVIAYRGEDESARIREN